jgi:hypothetical protein
VISEAANKSNGEKLFTDKTPKNVKEIKSDSTDDEVKSNIDSLKTTNNALKNSPIAEESKISHDLNIQPPTENKNVTFLKQNESPDKKESQENSFRVSVNDRNGQLQTQLTKLIYTPSGALNMELDEKIVTEIENKLNDNDAFACLRKTLSGHYVVDFNQKDDSSSNYFMVKRSPSGALLFEVDKNIVDNLEDNTTVINNVYDSKSSVSIIITLKPQDDSIAENITEEISNQNINLTGKVSKHVCAPDCNKKQVKHDIDERYKKLNKIMDL